jgi:hypothetical protein
MTILDDSERRHVLADMRESLKVIRPDYKPRLENGMIMTSCSMLIKSTLRGRPAMSDGHYVCEDVSGLMETVPEVGGTEWRKRHKNFDFLIDGVKNAKPIRPSVYDDIAVHFHNVTAIQRSYYDIFWMQFRHKGLMFQQDETDIEGVILVRTRRRIVGCVMPLLPNPEKARELYSLMQTYLKELGH